MKILCIDYGVSRIGVAIAEQKSKYAKPLEPIIIKNLKKNTLKKYLSINKIIELVIKNQCNQVIIGLPYSIDYTTGNKIENKQTIKIKKFAISLKKRMIKKRIETEIILIDESYTTILAQENLKNLGYRNKSIKHKIDSESARILLEYYLNNKTNHIKLDAQT